MGLKIHLGIFSFTIFAFMNAGESIGLAFSTLIPQPGFTVQFISVILSLMQSMAGFLSVNMPVPLDYLNRVSIMRYAARGQAFEVFKDIEFTCPAYSNSTFASSASTCQFRNGSDVMQLLNFPDQESTFIESMIGIAVCIFVYRLIAFIIMRLKLK